MDAWCQKNLPKDALPAKSNWEHLAPVVQMLDSAIQWINHYPLDNSNGFASVYPMDSDSSDGQRYPSFEQLGLGELLTKKTNKDLAPKPMTR